MERPISQAAGHGDPHLAATSFDEVCHSDAGMNLLLRSMT